MTDAEHDALRENSGLYVLDALAPEVHSAFEAHVSNCDVCAADVRRVSDGIHALASALPQVDPPATVRDRVRLTVMALLSGPHRTVSFASRAADTNNSGHMADSPSSKSRAFWAGWIIAAASLLVAAVAGVYAANLKQQLNDVELRLVDAVMKLQVADQQVTAAATQANAVRSNLALLASSDVQDLKLTGKAPAPDATGRVFISKSRGMLFSATKLPPVPDDRTYQLWFLTKAAPVSAGVVRPDADGNVTAAFDAPADAGAPTGFAVSIEPDGGGTAPTGAIYLASK